MAFCAAFGLLAASVALACALDERPLSPAPRFWAPTTAPSTSRNAFTALERPPLEARAPASSAPEATTAHAPPAFGAVAVPDPTTTPFAIRLPALDGLRLDPSAGPEDLARHYAGRSADELASARFRLGAVLTAFYGGGGASPIPGLLLSDVESLQRELVFIDERLAALPIEARELATVRADPADDEDAFARRHANTSSEELYVRARRLERARAAEELRLAERLWAAGDYEVVPESSFMT